MGTHSEIRNAAFIFACLIFLYAVGSGKSDPFADEPPSNIARAAYAAQFDNR